MRVASTIFIAAAMLFVAGCNGAADDLESGATLNDDVLDVSSITLLPKSDDVIVEVDVYGEKFLRVMNAHAGSAEQSIELELENGTQTEIHLSGIRYSCSCTRVDVATTTIPAGKSVPLKLSINPGAEGERKSQIDLLFDRPTIGVKRLIVLWNAVSSVAFKEKHIALETVPELDEIIEIPIVVRKQVEMQDGLYVCIVPNNLGEARLELEQSRVCLHFNQKPNSFDVVNMNLHKKDGVILDSFVLSFVDSQQEDLQLLTSLIALRNCKRDEWCFHTVTILGLGEKVQEGTVRDIITQCEGVAKTTIQSQVGDTLTIGILPGESAKKHGMIKIHLNGDSAFSVPFVLSSEEERIQP